MRLHINDLAPDLDAGKGQTHANGWRFIFMRMCCCCRVCSSSHGLSMVQHLAITAPATLLQTTEKKMT